MGISWDSVFLDGVVSERMMAQSAAGSNESKAVACAAALLGWANCMAGHRPPAKFGEGMMALADWAGLRVTDIQPDTAAKTAAQYLRDL